MRGHLLYALTTLLLLAVPARAADLPGPWVQFASDGSLEVRSIVAAGMECPRVAADDAVLPSTTRGVANDAYPVLACAARADASTRTLTVDGLPVATLPRDIKRIAVIGDTGCRLKGEATQDCNSPTKWPFAIVARLAAARRPDLVIHVGDYHYRESPCPATQPGCAGSPYGDNWAVWQKDFFDPAAPLLASAPWVVVRGNHELCNRGGHGWFRLLDPHPWADDCSDTTPPYRLRIGALNLLVLDSAKADDVSADAAQVAFYREQFRTLFADIRPHAWLLTHRPVWALAEGTGVPPGAMLNATEQAAIRDLVPSQLDMVLSGHVHDFMSFDFGPSRPSQLVVGQSGTRFDPIIQPVEKGVVIDGSPIRRGTVIAEYGYIMLHRSDQGWSATVYSLADRVLARCRLNGRDLGCRAASR